MSALDSLLGLLGTNRVRLRWKWEAARQRWAKKAARADNQARAFTYQHKICPSCGALADKSEKICARCGTPLGSRFAHRARKALALLVPAGALSGTGIMIGLCAGVFAAMIAHAGLGVLGVPEVETLSRFGAWTVGTVRGGETWRLLTANFVHIGALHLLMNGMALAQVAPLVEYAYGRPRFAALFVLSGVGGMATSYFYRQWTGENPIVAGASASIFGMIGAAAVYSFLSGRRELGGIFVRWAITALLLSFVIPADNAAHAGGLASGAVGALLLGRGRRLGPWMERAWRGAELALYAAVLVAFVAAWRAPAPADRRLDAFVDAVRQETEMCEGDPGCENLRAALQACLKKTGIELGPGFSEKDWQRLWTCVARDAGGRMKP